jgi:hypothetical protein
MISDRDPWTLTETEFIDWYLSDIFKEKKNLKSGVAGCILAKAWDRAAKILESNGIQAEIVLEIKDPECELTYLIKS